MRLFDPKLLLASTSLVLVTFLVVLDLGKTSPGPLSASHAAAEGLDEASCDLCHGDGELRLSDSCNACHEAISEQLAVGSGFHGALEGASDCGHCHVEHLGSEVSLVDARAFALAGFEPRDSYAHEGLTFELRGRHDELTCSECHANAEVAALSEGEQRFLGASQDCASCHEDPHEGRMVQSCEACHGQQVPFDDLAGFVHSVDFPLEGVHADASCTDCHAKGSDYAVEVLGGREAPAPRACAACHESPHGEVFLAGVASALATPAAASCGACHALDATGFVDFDRDASARWHGASGFELSPPHDQADCAGCHEPGERATRYLARSADDCASCHDSPHGAQFDAGLFADFDCLACHAREHFVPATFDAESHARTEFALQDGHSSAACADCHAGPPEQPLGRRDFGAVSRECSACHADVHAGLFAQVRAAADVPGDCDTCHTTTHFSDGAAEDFDHGAWTRFALDGAHVDADCEACHQRSASADALGRRFGRVTELFGEPADACATCHHNVHEGAMAGTSEDCASCHGTASFTGVDLERFDHGGATGFSLVGAHERADCAVCHAPREAPDGNGRTFGLVAETFGQAVERCADCHEDPHQGRFERLSGPRVVAGRVGCARCHDQERFLDGARQDFDHALWTGFALDGGHAEVSCEDCHVSPTPHSLGRTLGTSCAACHDDPHFGQFGPVEANRCERCHQSTAGFSTLVFDHQSDSRFALDASHADLDCVACHRAWPLAGGGEAIRYKPLGQECSDCHLGGQPK